MGPRAWRAQRRRGLPRGRAATRDSGLRRATVACERPAAWQGRGGCVGGEQRGEDGAAGAGLGGVRGALRRRRRAGAGGEARRGERGRGNAGGGAERAERRPPLACASLRRPTRCTSPAGRSAGALPVAPAEPAVSKGARGLISGVGRPAEAVHVESCRERRRAANGCCHSPCRPGGPAVRKGRLGDRTGRARRVHTQAWVERLAPVHTRAPRERLGGATGLERAPGERLGGLERAPGERLELPRAASSGGVAAGAPREALQPQDRRVAAAPAAPPLLDGGGAPRTALEEEGDCCSSAAAGCSEASCCTAAAVKASAGPR